MKLLDVIHPAAKTLVEIAKSQDAEVSFVFSERSRYLITMQWYYMHCFIT